MAVLSWNNSQPWNGPQTWNGFLDDGPSGPIETGRVQYAPSAGRGGVAHASPSASRVAHAGSSQSRVSAGG